MSVVALYTELFQAIIPTLFPYFFHSAIPTSHYIFNVFFYYHLLYEQDIFPGASTWIVCTMRAGSLVDVELVIA